jgi:hypothetical protein
MATTDDQDQEQPDPWEDVLDRERSPLHHPDVPLSAAMLDGRADLTLEHRDPTTGELVREPAGVVAVSAEPFRVNAYYEREAKRLIATWAAGNLDVWSHPQVSAPGSFEDALARTPSADTSAVVRIRTEAGVYRFETVRGPVFRMLLAAMERA